MQNNHIASVTLYGAPRTTGQARPESSSSSHWTSNQNHIPFWPVLNLVPLLTEPLTRSQILNQADLTQDNKALLAQLRRWSGNTTRTPGTTESDLTLISFSRAGTKIYSSNQTHPAHPMTSRIYVHYRSAGAFMLWNETSEISLWCCKLTKWRNLRCGRAQLFPVSILWLHPPRNTDDHRL